jgi:hypothetical protein
MKKTFFLAFTFLAFTNCNTKSKQAEYNAIRVKEINKIVETIIVDDSLNVLKDNEHSKMLSENLFRLTVFVPEKSKNNDVLPPPPPSFNNVSINELLNNRTEDNIFFKSVDSTYLLEQNLEEKNLKLNKNLIAKINSTTKQIELNKKEKGESFDFYEMSIPIFSYDKQKAYVELNHYCGGLCGNGVSIYLKKINGKWKIIQIVEGWIS